MEPRIRPLLRIRVARSRLAFAMVLPRHLPDESRSGAPKESSRFGCTRETICHRRFGTDPMGLSQIRLLIEQMSDDLIVSDCHAPGIRAANLHHRNLPEKIGPCNRAVTPLPPLLVT
jgi:hypothetical protein